MPETFELREREGRTIKWLVRVSAIVVGLLLAVFFAAVIQSASIIKGEVEHVKDGPYPISVAAGHLETYLVRLETVVEHMATTKLTPASEAYGETDPINEDSIRTIERQIQEQIDSVSQTATHQAERLVQFQKGYNLLSSRVAVFLTLYWHKGEGVASYDEVSSYAQEYIHPVIMYLLEFNQQTLDRTTDEVNQMYERVNEALATMLGFTVILMVAVVLMIGIYMMMLNLRNRFEAELRASLNRAMVAANEANVAKSAFLANMSHDIRTPMNAIVGLTTIASENIDDKLRVKQCLTRIATSSQHLLALINDVLDMNKIESGKVVITQEEFSLSELAREIDTIFNSQPASKKRNNEVVLDDIDHDVLIGDAMRLRQILLNLTSNALKYTQEGDVTRLIVRERPASEPDYVTVTFIVQDTGIGMTPEFVQRVFEPFEREENDFTAFTEGTGLGMAITKNLVELMGGTIRVESELGRGTRFTIELDFKVAPPTSVLRSKVAREGKLATAVTGKHVKGNVLVVEDNEINMEIAMQLLTSRGADVDGAVDGLEAVAKVSDSPEGTYDLIFMDCQMPKMDGLEATRAIRKFLDAHGRTQIPIVAMTANAFESDREAVLEAGMNDFVAKPINIKQLEEVLATYLQPACAKGAKGTCQMAHSADSDEGEAAEGEKCAIWHVPLAPLADSDEGDAS